MPCPLATSGTLTFDTSKIADGAHKVRMLVRDAAGNETAWNGPTIKTYNTPPDVSCVPEPLAANAGTLKSVDYKFVSKTTVVPARRGVGFGIEYRVRGAPKDVKVPLRMVTIFPSGGLHNPKTGKTVLRNEYVEEKPVGALLLKGYTLDDDWEVVPGTWTFQIWFGDQLLAEKVFTVTPQ